jgi:GTP-binding protein
MLPVVALVGRPNVGKSTLFNRITRSRDALVAEHAGLTRDRQYGRAVHAGRRFIAIDTGGLSGDEQGIDAAMAAQSEQAIVEADVVLLLVDSRAGLSAIDRAIAGRLRTTGKPVLLVANKIDGADPVEAQAELSELGFAELFPVSAAHGRGVHALLDALVAQFPPLPQPSLGGGAEERAEGRAEGHAEGHFEARAEAPAEAPAEAQRGLKIAIVGRPNVGKSTLVNRMLGEDRVVVFDQPGTTRDSIYIDYQRDGKSYTLIDTAGVRRRKNIDLVVEKFSIVKTLQAIQDANVVVLVMDAREGIVDQDLHLLGYTLDSGRAVVLAVNKWDGLDDYQKRVVRTQIDRRLQFVNFAETHFISALHGSGVGNLYGAIDTAYRAATADLSTPRLTRILEDAVADHPPPLVRGRRIKLRYAHPGGSNPPIVVIHGNQVDELPGSYRRYLEKVYRRELQLYGTPVRIELRSGENPFAGRRNVLTPRQQRKRERMMKHVRKQKGKRK